MSRIVVRIHNGKQVHPAPAKQQPLPAHSIFTPVVAQPIMVQPPAPVVVPMLTPTVVQPAVEIPAYSAADQHPEVLPLYLLTGLGLVAVVGVGILACRALAGLAIALRPAGVGLAGFLRGQGRALWDLTVDDVEDA